LDRQIEALEAKIERWRCVLPVCSDWWSLSHAVELRDPWGFPLKGGPCGLITGDGLGLDEFAQGAYQERLVNVESTDSASKQLGDLLRQVIRLKGRGYRCGALSEGVCGAVVAELAGIGRRMDEFMASMIWGTDLNSAYFLLQTLQGCVDEDDVEMLRVVFARLVHLGAPDEEFKALLTGELAEMDALMKSQFSPPWLSWSFLAAAALGVVSFHIPTIPYPDPIPAPEVPMGWDEDWAPPALPWAA
jgi:hypothetical protein